MIQLKTYPEVYHSKRITNILNSNPSLPDEPIAPIKTYPIKPTEDEYSADMIPAVAAE